MSINSPYREAHLIVAAVRILEHLHKGPPAIEQVAGLLSVSIEEAGMACRKLESVGILEIIEKSGEARLFIGEHRLIEKLPDKTEKNRLSRDLEKFYREKQAERKTIDALRSMQEEKRKKINKQIEQQLKNKISEISSKKK
jgi:hypothetical protein